MERERFYVAGSYQSSEADKNNEKEKEAASEDKKEIPSDVKKPSKVVYTSVEDDENAGKHKRSNDQSTRYESSQKSRKRTGVEPQTKRRKRNSFTKADRLFDKSNTEYAFPVTRSEIEEMRTWMEEDNATMEEIYKDPYYRFAVQVATETGARSNDHYIRNEYKEYMKYHGRLHDVFGHSKRLADQILQLIPSAEYVYRPDYDDRNIRDEEGAQLGETVRREMLKTLAFMHGRMRARDVIRALGHQTSYRHRALLTPELDAKCESALAILKRQANSSMWQAITVDDLIVGDNTWNIFASFIALEKARNDTNNAKRPVLQVHFRRIMAQRAAAIQTLIHHTPRIENAYSGITHSGNPILNIDNI